MSLTDSNTLFLVILAATAGFLLMRAGRYFAKQRRERPLNLPPSSQVTERRGLDAESEELNRWDVEMHETARNLCGQLDSKMSALAALVDEADRAAARLEAALARAAEAARQSGTQAEALRWTTRTRGDAAGPAALPEEGLGLKAPDSGDGDRGAPAETPGVAAPSNRGRRHDEIYTLSDYGFDPAEIARRLVMPIGEVELILGLRGKE